MKNRRENVYCDTSDKIFNIWNNPLLEALIPAPMTILVILFCSLKLLLLYEFSH